MLSNGRYREEEKRPLCIFLCNTAYDNKIVIVPLVPIAYDSNCICLANVNQYANLSDVKEIDSKQIINPLYLIVPLIKYLPLGI